MNEHGCEQYGHRWEREGRYAWTFHYPCKHCRTISLDGPYDEDGNYIDPELYEVNP